MSSPSPTSRLVLNDALRHSDILAWTFSFKHDVVCLTSVLRASLTLDSSLTSSHWSTPGWVALAILGEEVEHARREFFVFLPIDVVVKAEISFSPSL